MNENSFLQRLLIYQKERFPLLGNGLLVVVFTFSAISYSRISRGVDGFIAWEDFLIGVFLTLGLFFLLRIFDEHKDQEDDRKYRSYLPVPRGLISLAELRKVGWCIFILQAILLVFFQTQMLILFFIVLAYMLLMGEEFFVPEYLRKHQMLYNLSHMFIIPLVDIYASGLDWFLEGHPPHWGLAWFFGVSYFNGLVLEFGRKMRAPDYEEEGVNSYTKQYGVKKGPMIWLLFLIITAALAIGAALYAGYGLFAVGWFLSCLILCSIPTILFIKNPTKKLSKSIEIAAGIWTLLMYFSLGAIPMIKNLLT